MRIGVPREIKSQENRVALRPVGAEILTRDGHEVWIERGAGGGSGFTDDAYGKAGARLVDGPEPVFAECEMILKVKEPLAEEIRRIRPGQIVFTYFHFAASRELTEGMIASGAVALAYETVEEEDGDGLHTSALAIDFLRRRCGRNNLRRRRARRLFARLGH